MIMNSLKIEMRAEVYSHRGRSLQSLEWRAVAPSLDSIMLSGRELICRQPRYIIYISYHYFCLAGWRRPEQINHRPGVNPIVFPSAAGNQASHLGRQCWLWQTRSQIWPFYSRPSHVHRWRGSLSWNWMQTSHPPYWWQYLITPSTFVLRSIAWDPEPGFNWQ